MPTNVDKLKAFEAALKDINSKTKSATGTLIAKLGDRPINIETISTGSLVLDSILGGGLGKGRIVEVYGAESSGKTTIALTAAADVQSRGGTVAFIDFENALDPRYATKLGVDIPNMALSQPDYAEQGLQLVEDLAASAVVDLIIVDSVAALVPKIELEGELEQQNIGVVARLMSRSLKKLVSTSNRTGTTVIFINQTRDNIGGFSPFGTPQTTTGGKALRFYSSQRIEIKRGQQVKEGKDIIGSITKFTIKKNKLAPPFLTGETVVSFNKGVNRAAELIEVGPAFGVILRPNTRTYIDAETNETIATNKADAIKAIEDDVVLYNRLSKNLKTALVSAIESGEQPETFLDEESDTEE
jgi:recombination protein RecA